MQHDPLAAALAKVLNAERVGKREVLIKPASTMVKTILQIMNEHNFVGTFEMLEDGRGGIVKVNLLGNINKCGVIKPRFPTRQAEFEKWEKRYLPAKDFGIILMSTPIGIMTHYQAREKKVGGRLVAYCY